MRNKILGSKQSDGIDDSILIEIGKGQEILSIITSGVDQAEHLH